MLYQIIIASYLCFIAQCTCSSNFPDTPTFVYYHSSTGKCYATFTCSYNYVWQSAQDYCSSISGVNNHGRLATFATCADYETVKTNMAGSCSMWIGVQNGDTLPVWNDPNGACTTETSNSTDLSSGSCSLNNFNQACMEITSSWSIWLGMQCNNNVQSFLCEFGNIVKTSYVI